MTDIIISLFALFITLPVPSWFLTYVIARKIFGHSRRAFHTASDLSTFLFVLSVSACLYVIFGHSYLAWILVFLILIQSFLLFFQWKTKHEVVFSKAFKVFLRFSFLLFSALYLILICYGIYLRLTEI